MGNLDIIHFCIHTVKKCEEKDNSVEWPMQQLYFEFHSIVILILFFNYNSTSSSIQIQESNSTNRGVAVNLEP